MAELVLKSRLVTLVTLVDDVDLDFINYWTWTAIYRREVPYVGRRVWEERRTGAKRGSHTVMLHNVIACLMGHLLEPGIEVDHRDRNPLNNCRSNLRLATKQQNMINRRKWGKSEFRGVSVSTGQFRIKAFEARMTTKEGTKKSLGRFETAREAARAWDMAMIEEHGEFALGVLNFPKVDNG